MRSSFIIIAAVLTAAVVLSSCGSPGNKAEEPVRAAVVETAAAAAETVETAAAAAEPSAAAAETAGSGIAAAEADAETAAEITAVETAAAADDAVKRDASFPTGEPLTMPAVIPPQHTAEAPRMDLPENSGSQSANAAEQALNTGSSQQDPGKKPPASQKATIMQVVNCKEWISLRTMPSTSADTITRIPLGERVVFAGPAENGFYQVTYQGNTGYALAEYLVLVQ